MSRPSDRSGPHPASSPASTAPGSRRRQETYVVARAHLLQNPGAGDAFSSLSAFASLHTAFTFLILLSAYVYRLRLLSIVIAVYFAGVVVATIYFGWHFVLDDIAGCAMAALALYLGRLVVYPRGHPRPAVT